MPRRSGDPRDLGSGAEGARERLCLAYTTRAAAINGYPLDRKSPITLTRGAASGSAPRDLYDHRLSRFRHTPLHSTRPASATPRCRTLAHTTYPCSAVRGGPFADAPRRADKISTEGRRCPPPPSLPSSEETLPRPDSDKAHRVRKGLSLLPAQIPSILGRGGNLVYRQFS